MDFLSHLRKMNSFSRFRIIFASAAILLPLLYLDSPIIYAAGSEITLESGENIPLLELPDSIQGIKVQGRTICDINLLKDVMLYVKSAFEAQAKDKLESLFFNYIKGKKYNYDNKLIWSERWFANGSLGSREYEVEFQNLPSSGTDFSIREIVATDNKKLAMEYYERGVNHDLNHDFPQSVAAYTSAIEMNPGFAWAYSNRGSAYVDMGDFSKAIEDFNKAILINPGIYNFYYNRGFVHFKQGNLAQSISDYTKAIELKPDLAEAYGSRAVVYAEVSDYDKAWADVHRSEELGFRLNDVFLSKLKTASGRGK